MNRVAVELVGTSPIVHNHGEDDAFKSIDGVVDALEAAGEVVRADFLFWAVRYEPVWAHECPEEFTPHGYPFFARGRSPKACQECRTKRAALVQIRAALADPSLRLDDWDDCPVNLARWRVS